MSEFRKVHDELFLLNKGRGPDKAPWKKQKKAFLEAKREREGTEPI